MNSQSQFAPRRHADRPVAANSFEPLQAEVMRDTTTADLCGERLLGTPRELWDTVLAQLKQLLAHGVFDTGRMDTAAIGYQDGALLVEVSNPCTQNRLESPQPDADHSRRLASDGLIGCAPASRATN